jgi:hypothetical protein
LKVNQQDLLRKVGIGEKICPDRWQFVLGMVWKGLPHADRLGADDISVAVAGWIGVYDRQEVGVGPIDVTHPDVQVPRRRPDRSWLACRE